MSHSIVHKIWAIPEGYIPSKSTGPAPEFTSHETACILNTGDEDANTCGMTLRIQSVPKAIVPRMAVSLFPVFIL